MHLADVTYWLTNSSVVLSPLDCFGRPLWLPTASTLSNDGRSDAQAPPSASNLSVNP